MPDCLRVPGINAIFDYTKTINMKTTETHQAELNVKLENFLGQFPDDATKWNQATDEIRDMAYRIRSAYNEHTLDVVEGDEGYIESLNFRSFRTPAQWNQGAKKQIRNLWTRMNDWSRTCALNDL